MNIDKKLLQSCIKNDRKAQQDLYKTCFSMLMSVCIRYRNNEEDARSLVNMGFLKILTNMNKYDTKIPFEAWIRRIMTNTIIDEYRKERKQKELIEYKNFEDNDNNDDLINYNEADQKFDASDLERMIKQLPNMSQKVFNLYIIDGYNHREIGNMLDISVGTSKWHLSSARKNIKEILAKKMMSAKTMILWIIGIH